MAVVQTLIGNIKGPQGEQGEQGEQGVQGDAATIAVGSVTTVPYGQNARVTNSGTSGAAVFDFVIPQGRSGEQVTKIDNLTIDAITEPSTQFPVPAVGDNGSTLFGKISKWFSDMAALVATKLNAANVVNNLTTTASGYALDARQGKALNDKWASSMLFSEDVYTITDTQYGFIQLPISASTYAIVSIFSTASNRSIRVSNLGTGNYRIQIINALDGNILLSGDHRIIVCYMPRSVFHSA